MTDGQARHNWPDVPFLISKMGTAAVFRSQPEWLRELLARYFEPLSPERGREALEGSMTSPSTGP